MNKSHHHVVYFEIPVNDLDRAMNFYQLVFGFEFEQDIIEDNEMAFFSLDGGDNGMSGALAKGEIYKPTNNGVLIYFFTENIDETLKRAISNGGKTLFPKTFNEGWGFVAEFEDTEGNRIALKQPL
uniref:VOC family protein n=1 Tax=Pedobacter schmidteae TaxID=2201271 RepID=UPI000EAB60CD|nr:VOC family protein [Pedobacter schmidteae]